MEAYRVSRAVNTARNNKAELLIASGLLIRGRQDRRTDRSPAG